MKSRRKTVICREGWYYLMVLGFVVTGSVLREVNLLMVLAGMMFFPFLLNWRAVLVGVGGLDSLRKAPARIAAGDVLHVDIHVTKAAPWLCFGRTASWGLVVEDRLENMTFSDCERPASARTMLWKLAAGERQRTGYCARLNRRGRYRLGPVTISTRFPLGLVRRSKVFEDYQSLTVLPRLGQLTRRWTMMYQESYVGSRRSRYKIGNLEGDFHSLRDWRPSDGTRWIHWRTTARRGAPVVRQFEEKQHSNIALLVDLWRPAKPQFADNETLERIVSFAATVVTDVCRRGNSELLLGVAGKDIEMMHGPASSGLMYEMLDALAVCRADGRDRLPELLARTLDEMPVGMSLLIVSPRDLEAGNSPQLESIWSHPRRRAAAGRITTIQGGSSEMDELFLLD